MRQISLPWQQLGELRARYHCHVNKEENYKPDIIAMSSRKRIKRHISLPCQQGRELRDRYRRHVNKEEN